MVVILVVVSVGWISGIFVWVCVPLFSRILQAFLLLLSFFSFSRSFSLQWLMILKTKSKVSDNVIASILIRGLRVNFPTLHFVPNHFL